MIKKENKLFVIIIIGVLLTLLVTIVGGKAFSNKIGEIKATIARSESSDTIDWEELYPYRTVVEEAEVDHLISYDDSLITEITNILSKFSTLGNEWSKYFWGAMGIDRVGFIIHSKLTDPSIGTTYVKLKNGYWIIRSSEILSNTATKTVAPYAGLNNYLKGIGTDFLFFYAPRKDCEIDDQYPAGVTSYDNASIDKYLQAMENYGINYVDLREELHADGQDHYSMFYKTDHHWTVEAGLWAASVMEQKISDVLTVEMIDPYDMGTYHSITYPKAEFGSIGEAVTRYVAEPEDFTVLYPDFNTCYRLVIPNKGIDLTGSFEELFVDEEAIEELAETGGGAAYETISYGSPPYEKIINLNNPNGPKILMIRDSFAGVVAPYLAASCSELVMLDPRSDNGNFTGSIIECINQEKPDIVIVLLCYPFSIRLNK